MELIILTPQIAHHVINSVVIVPIFLLTVLPAELQAHIDLFYSTIIAGLDVQEVNMEILEIINVRIATLIA